MNSRRDESTWRYERDAEVTRHRLADGLNELSGRLTPGQIFDEMLTYARGGGGTFLRALSNASRDNPIPTLLVGAGCMMFLSERMGLNRYMTGSNGADTVHRASSPVGESTARHADGSGLKAAVSDQVSGVAKGVKSGTAAVGDTMSSAAQRTREMAHDLRDQASDTADKIKQGTQQFADKAKEYSSEMTEQIGETVSEASRRTMRGAKEARESVVSFVQEQPILAAAIGIAAGAAIAAMLPRTQTEDQLMGDASDAVKGAVGEVASEQFQSAKSAAGRVAQEAMNVAEREGLTTAAAVDAAKQVGEKMRSVGAEASAAGKTEVHELAGTGDKRDLS